MILLCCLAGLLATANAQSTVVPVEIKGVKTAVNVRRDERAIPYIEAKNLRDLYFAQGYVTASDRLWQMDLTRRTARGELSEVLGRLALEEDKRHRTFGFTQVAEATLPLLKPASRAALDAYADGVNAYIATLNTAALPPEFKTLGYRPRPWTPVDSLLISKLFAEFLSTTWREDLQRAAFADLPAEKKALLFPEYSPFDVLVAGDDREKTGDAEKGRKSENVLLPNRALALLAEANRQQENATLALQRIGLTPEIREASNNWVVSGKRTATGKPLLANDPHLRATAPNIWYMAHLSAPGLRVAGVTAPGAPGVLLGHNENIAWGATNLGPDVQDLYAEKFDPQHPTRYMTPQGWREATLRREEIKVRTGFANTDTTTEIHEVTVTRHGPVLLQQQDISYALQWTALTPRAGDFEGFFGLQTARDWAGFTASLGQYTGPTQNFIYADTRGNIGYYGAGAIPVRKSGDGSTPYDGATDAGEWTGLIPAQELPRSYNPPSGIIVTANSRVVGKSYKHFLTHSWFAPVRARRIYDLLTAKPKLTMDDFLAVQGNIASLSGEIFAREVSKMPAGNDAVWQKFQADLKAWDARMAANSSTALLVTETRNIFRRRILAGVLGARAQNFTFWANDATMVDGLLTEQPAKWLPAEFASYAALLQDCLREARANLTKRLGADETKWTWGMENQVRFFHPLAQLPLIGKPFLVEPFPQNGTGFTMATPNVGASVSMRHVSEPGRWDDTRFGLGLGQSGDPNSPYWKDQLQDWQTVKPRAFPFTPAAVNRATRTFTQLVPAP